MKLRKQKKHWLQNIFTGIQISLGITLGLGLTGLLAVAVTGTFNTFTSGAVVKSSEMNTNFSTLKTAVEGIVSSQWVSSGANVGYTAGNVGIGTTSPNTRLEIKSSGANVAAFRIESSVNTNPLFRFVQNNSNEGVLQVNGADGVTDSQLGSDGLNSFVSDKFGIGTNSPTAKLTITQAGGTNTDGIQFVNGGVTNFLYSDAGGAFRLESNSNSNTLIVRGDGKVLIGTASPDGTNLFTVNSSNVSKTGGGAWNSISDIRLKHKIQSYREGLDLINKIQPILYNYKKNDSIQLKDEGQQIGISAQELKKIIPNSVTEGRGGYLQFKQDYVFWTMLNSIKELKSLNDINVSEVTKQKAEGEKTLSLLREFQKENTKLREELTALRQRTGTRWTEIDERLKAIETTKMAGKY